MQPIKPVCAHDLRKSGQGPPDSARQFPEIDAVAAIVANQDVADPHDAQVQEKGSSPSSCRSNRQRWGGKASGQGEWVQRQPVGATGQQGCEQAAAEASTDDGDPIGTSGSVQDRAHEGREEREGSHGHDQVERDLVAGLAERNAKNSVLARATATAASAAAWPI